MSADAPNKISAARAWFIGICGLALGWAGVIVAAVAVAAEHAHNGDDTVDENGRPKVGSRGWWAHRAADRATRRADRLQRQRDWLERDRQMQADLTRQRREARAAGHDPDTVAPRPGLFRRLGAASRRTVARCVLAANGVRRGWVATRNSVNRAEEGFRRGWRAAAVNVRDGYRATSRTRPHDTTENTHDPVDAEILPDHPGRPEQPPGPARPTGQEPESKPESPPQSPAESKPEPEPAGQDPEPTTPGRPKAPREPEPRREPTLLPRPAIVAEDPPPDNPLASRFGPHQRHPFANPDPTPDLTPDPIAGPAAADPERTPAHEPEGEPVSLPQHATDVKASNQPSAVDGDDHLDVIANGLGQMSGTLGLVDETTDLVASHAAALRSQAAAVLERAGDKATLETRAAADAAQALADRLEALVGEVGMTSAQLAEMTQAADAGLDGARAAREHLLATGADRELIQVATDA